MALLNWLKPPVKHSHIYITENSDSEEEDESEKGNEDVTSDVTPDVTSDSIALVVQVLHLTVGQAIPSNQNALIRYG